MLIRMSARRSVPAFVQAFCISLFALLIPNFGEEALAQPAQDAPAPFLAESLGNGAVAIDGAWQFHLGDNLAWAQPGIQDATGLNGWEAIKADAPWGTQAHPNYTGYGWYRRHLQITTAPGVPPNVTLLISAIDDVYEVYWNGVRVGGLGSFPPNVSWKFGIAAQTYGLGPARDGVLAVRVLKLPPASTDNGSGGGFEGPPHLGTPDAIARYKDSLDYGWLRDQQFTFGLTTL
jgi:hypothetical protein